MSQNAKKLRNFVEQSKLSQKEFFESYKLSDLGITFNNLFVTLQTAGNRKSTEHHEKRAELILKHINAL